MGRIVLTILFFSGIYAQCDNYDEIDCVQSEECNWIENIAYGNCADLSENDCGFTSACLWNYDVETVNCNTLPTYGWGVGSCDYYYPDCYEYLDYGGSYGSWSTACGGGVVQIDNSSCFGGVYEIENMSYCSEVISECVYPEFIETFDSDCFPANQNNPYYYDTTVGSHTPGIWEGECDEWNFTYENGWTSFTDLYGGVQWYNYVASFPFIIYETAANAWHQSLYNSYDRNNYWCANENGNSYDNEWVQYLDTPLLFIPSNSQLSADMSWNIEAWQGASVPGTCVDGWDQANVQISTNGGQSFELLNGSTAYDFDCGYGSVYNGFSGMPGWGGSRNWHQVLFDLSEYANQDVIIRFAFYSDPAVVSTGLQVDNITVQNNQSDDHIFFDDAESDMLMLATGNENYLSVHMAGNNWGEMQTEWGKISTATTPVLDLSLCDYNILSYNYSINDNALLRTYVASYDSDVLIATHTSLSTGHISVNLNDYIDNASNAQIRFESESDGYSSSYDPTITTIKNLILPPLLGSSPDYQLGDVNYDGLINVIDVVAVVNAILDDNYIALGDLNNDGSVNVSDIVQLVSIILNN